MGDLPLERLGENVLRFLAQFLDAPVAAVFVAEGASFRRAAAHGIPAGEVAWCSPETACSGRLPRTMRRFGFATCRPDSLRSGSSTGRSDARSF